MFRTAINEEIKTRSTGLGKIFVDALFGVWTLIGTALFMWFIDRFFPSNNEN